MSVLVEICVGDLESALAAAQGRADRIELCADLAGGGTTPSHGTVALATELITVPIFVLIRPRAGDFVPSRHEFAAMLHDVVFAKVQGASGVVIGVLHADRTIDRARVSELIAVARPLEVTFHRAFDSTINRIAALEVLIALGVDRVLTSGGGAMAMEGLGLLSRTVAHAGGRIGILAGGGVSEANVATIIERTGVREIHAGSSVARPWPGAISPAVPTPVMPWDQPITRTDATLVEQLVRVARLSRSKIVGPL